MPDAIENNAKIFARFTRTFSTLKRFVEEAGMFSKWLNNRKAYYPIARPEIIRILELARDTLEKSNVQPGDPCILGYQTMIFTAWSYREQFLEPELKSRLEGLRSGLSFVDSATPLNQSSIAIPSAPSQAPTQTESNPSPLSANQPENLPPQVQTHNGPNSTPLPMHRPENLPSAEEYAKRKASTAATKPRKKKKIDYSKFAEVDMADSVSQSSLLNASLPSQSEPISDVKDGDVEQPKLAPGTENKAPVDPLSSEKQTPVTDPQPGDVSMTEIEVPAPRPDAKVTVGGLWSSPSMQKKSPKVTETDKLESAKPEVEIKPTDGHSIPNPKISPVPDPLPRPPSLPPVASEVLNHSDMPNDGQAGPHDIEISDVQGQEMMTDKNADTEMGDVYQTLQSLPPSSSSSSPQRQPQPQPEFQAEIDEDVKVQNAPSENAADRTAGIHQNEASDAENADELTVLTVPASVPVSRPESVPVPEPEPTPTPLRESASLQLPPSMSPNEALVDAHIHESTQNANVQMPMDRTPPNKAQVPVPSPKSTPGPPSTQSQSQSRSQSMEAVQIPVPLSSQLQSRPQSSAPQDTQVPAPAPALLSFPMPSTQSTIITDEPIQTSHMEMEVDHDNRAELPNLAQSRTHSRPQSLVPQIPTVPLPSPVPRELLNLGLEEKLKKALDMQRSLQQTLSEKRKSMVMPNSVFVPSVEFNHQLRILSCTPGLQREAVTRFTVKISPTQFNYLTAWNNRVRNPAAVAHSGASCCVSLGCYLKKDLPEEKTRQHSSFPYQLFNDVKTTWPKNRKLTMVVNVDGQEKRIPMAPPLRITPDGFFELGPFLRVGQNDINLLAEYDMSSYMFILMSHQPTKQQKEALRARIMKDRSWVSSYDEATRPFDVSVNAFNFV
ncbi:hypothetical protein D9758_001735 [Tetrapyrgos nigripes]|uniref:Uncharacterized protein n=1 Tax=Tetrapyrgos nigripes TaxID=182062 RepID=A0A8H5LXD0_9AGAR|nr:hypothetical protein D9758_001735 [Tetrapyrgos nigripes]